MRKFVTALVLGLVIAISQTSCKKDKPLTNIAPTNPPLDTTVTVVTPTTNVYVAGDTLDGGTKSAVYWVNGKEIHLPLPGYSYATSIAVSGNDIYVTAPGSIVADSVTYWKNGQKVVLQDTMGIGIAARTITVSGNDVYA